MLMTFTIFTQVPVIKGCSKSCLWKHDGFAKKAQYGVCVLGCSGSAPCNIFVDGLNSTAAIITSHNHCHEAIISMSLGGASSAAVNTICYYL